MSPEKAHPAAAAAAVSPPNPGENSGGQPHPSSQPPTVLDAVFNRPRPTADTDVPFSYVHA